MATPWSSALRVGNRVGSYLAAQYMAPVISPKSTGKFLMQAWLQKYLVGRRTTCVGKGYRVLGRQLTNEEQRSTEQKRARVQFSAVEKTQRI